MKKLILETCIAYAEEKRNRVKKAIALVKDSLTSESKSTAGDKHETGRAMLQLEREKLGTQLKQSEEIVLQLKRIDPNFSSKTVQIGSYIKTNKASYFICAPLGKLAYKNSEFFAISIHSPIGKLLLGKSINDTIAFNGTSQTIITIH